MNDKNKKPSILDILRSDDTVVYLLQKFPMPGTYWMKAHRDPHNRVYQIISIDKPAGVADDKIAPGQLMITYKDVVTGEKVQSPLGDFLELYFQGKIQ
jgi:hypothetical protein